MEIQFISYIKKGNQNGTGFFYIPRDNVSMLKLGDWVQVRLLNDIHFFPK